MNLLEADRVGEQSRRGQTREFLVGDDSDLWIGLTIKEDADSMTRWVVLGMVYAPDEIRFEFEQAELEALINFLNDGYKEAFE